MKKCVVCKSESASEAATCPKCGESSWGLPYEAPTNEEPAPEPKKGKRGK